MPNKRYFSYVRVSTQRQGQLGTSLTEQQTAIESHAEKWNLQIVKRFEERETAAKLGRPVFLEMLKSLKQGKADGVIIHKIDRSARNLKDWADLGSLLDSGLEVHFASESLDLNSRGGRLSADIQAVVASDYIRNLREETLKGIYGRLKQGLYPFRAVIGYMDCGKGQPKTLDPVQALFVKQVFELYATGEWGLIALGDEMYRRGLRNKSGKKVTINGLSTLLHNPFYTGVIKIKRSGEVFAGVHEPIVSSDLFKQVQAVFQAKNIKKQNRHFFLFRRLIKCRSCGNHLIAERQKGLVYYRCHTQNCQRTTLKEETVEDGLLAKFKKMQMTDEEYRFLRQEAAKENKKLSKEREAVRNHLLLQEKQIKDRLSVLADAYVDGVFDRETYLEKKNALIFKERAVKEKLTDWAGEGDAAATRFDAFLELVNTAYLSYILAKTEDKRELVKIMMSNFSAMEKSVLVVLKTEFEMLAARPSFTCGSPCREARRTFEEFFRNLFIHLNNLDISKYDNNFVNYINSKREENEKSNLLALDK